MVCIVVMHKVSVQMQCSLVAVVFDMRACCLGVIYLLLTEQEVCMGES